MAKSTELIIPVRLEIENRAEVLRLYHALGEFLMATDPRPDADRG